MQHVFGKVPQHAYFRQELSCLTPARLLSWFLFLIRYDATPEEIKPILDGVNALLLPGGHPTTPEGARYPNVNVNRTYRLLSLLGHYLICYTYYGALRLLESPVLVAQLPLNSVWVLMVHHDCSEILVSLSACRWDCNLWLVPTASALPINHSTERANAASNNGEKRRQLRPFYRKLDIVLDTV